MARRRRNQRQQTRALGAIAHGQQNDTMDHDSTAMKCKKPHTDSDYGSDIDLVPAASEYGSDIDLDDIDEEALLVSATAARTVVYPSVEIQAVLEGRDEDAPRLPALRCAYSSPPHRKKSPVEFEYDAPSRRAFSGMCTILGPPSRLTTDRIQYLSRTRLQ